MTPLLPRMQTMYERVELCGLPAVCWYMGEDEYDRLVKERPDIFPSRSKLRGSGAGASFLDLAIICLPELAGVELGIECLQ